MAPANQLGLVCLENIPVDIDLVREDFLWKKISDCVFCLSSLFSILIIIMKEELLIYYTTPHETYSEFVVTTGVCSGRFKYRKVFMSRMGQKISSGDRCEGTGNIILEALESTASKRIVLNASFLDDEKLPEAERVFVLREVFHRNIRLAQLKRLAGVLASVAGGVLPPNLLVYGPTGTGKSVTCLHFLSNLSDMCAKNDVPFQYHYIDLTTPKSCFGALNELGLAIDATARRYRKGIALEHMQENIIAAFHRVRGFVCLLIDEVDNITRDADVFWTFLAKTLPKKVPVQLHYVFLTNRLDWDKGLDPRILGVLKKQDMVFEPYDAMDLLEILRLRVEKALDVDKVDEAAIRKIAGYASRETGDARRAVELLAKAVKVAEESSGRLTEKEVDAAEQRLEIDKTEELVRALAPQQRTALQACYMGLAHHKTRISTGTAYQWYQRVCTEDKTRLLTQRRFSDMISLMDLYGLLNARVTSRGRYGQTREISGVLPNNMVAKVIGNTFR